MLVSLSPTVSLTRTHPWTILPSTAAVRTELGSVQGCESSWHPFCPLPFRPSISYFPTHRFCRLGCVVCTCFCGWFRPHYASASAPSMVRTTWSTIIKGGHHDSPDDTASAFCCLLAGLGDHPTSYLALNLNALLIQSLLPNKLSYENWPGLGFLKNFVRWLGHFSWYDQIIYCLCRPILIFPRAIYHSLHACVHPHLKGSVESTSRSSISPLPREKMA